MENHRRKGTPICVKTRKHWGKKSDECALKGGIQYERKILAWGGVYVKNLIHLLDPNQTNVKPRELMKATLETCNEIRVIAEQVESKD